MSTPFWAGAWFVGACPPQRGSLACSASSHGPEMSTPVWASSSVRVGLSSTVVVRSTVSVTVSVLAGSSAP